MLRDITIRIDVSDSNLANVLPSSTVWVELVAEHNAIPNVLEGYGEILFVKDLPDEDA